MLVFPGCFENGRPGWMQRDALIMPPRQTTRKRPEELSSISLNTGRARSHTISQKRGRKFRVENNREIEYYKSVKGITVNVSSFEDLRTKGDYIYVDKTKYVYSLVENELNNYYFISRPRRYGKSLMCSTLHALFEGKRELFKGLYIDSTDYSFEKYPVLHFNFAEFNTDDYDTTFAKVMY